MARIIADLEQFCLDEGIARIEDLVGTLAGW
jgi:hypothetical protein